MERAVGAEGHAEGHIAKLNAAVTAGLADPELQKRMTEMGLDNVDGDQHTPEALGTLRRPRSTSGGRSSRQPA